MTAPIPLLVALAANVAAALLLGCGRGDTRDDREEHALVRIDRTRCVPSSRLESSREAVAVLCAEAFVARNGYTDAPPTADSAQLAFESIEFSRSPPELLANRRNTLEPRAYGVCPLGRVGPGLTVVFRYREDTLRRTGRAVRMTAGLDSLRVQHQDFILTNVADSGAKCQRVVPVRSEIRQPRPVRP